MPGIDKSTKFYLFRERLDVLRSLWSTRIDVWTCIDTVDGSKMLMYLPPVWREYDDSYVRLINMFDWNTTTKTDEKKVYGSIVAIDTYVSTVDN